MPGADCIAAAVITITVLTVSAEYQDVPLNAAVDSMLTILGWQEAFK
jgi:hypothetical protein